MSVMLYWQERLEAQNPLYSESLRIDKVNVRPMHGMDPKASWPRAISRSALYEDYCRWHKDQFLQLYRGIAWSGPMPKPAEELIFFSTMSPWLYVVGKDEQVRTYLVPHSEKYEGEWVHCKKNRYFIRLLDWQYHAVQFELTTGVFVFNRDMTAEDRIRMVEGAKANYRKVLDHNRHQMKMAMSGEAFDADA